MVVEPHIAVQCGFQLLARAEVVRLQHILDPAVEAFDHAVGLRVHRRGQAVLDAEVGAQLVERVPAGGAAFVQPEQAVGEFLAARHCPRTNGGHGSLGQYGADAYRAGAFEIAQKAAGVGGGLGVVDADEHPAGRPVNRHKQVAPGRFVGHLRQILDVDMQIAGRVGLECLVLGPGRFYLQIAQIAHPFAIGLEPRALNGSPALAAVEAGARHLRVQEFPERAIAGAIGSSPMASASRSSMDTSSVLRRTTATASCAGVSVQRENDPPDRFLFRLTLQPVRRVAAVMNAVAVFPFVDGLLGRAEPLRQNRRRRITGLDRRPHLRCRRGLAVKMDQHVRTPLRMSRRTDLAMKNADRRGDM